MMISASSYYANLGGGYTLQANGTRNDRNTAKADDQKIGNNAPAEQQQSQIQTLKQRDTEVRNHEQAHLSAAAGIAVSGAHFNYTTGPDGRRYAIGGEVNIDTSPVSGDPEATLRKADTIRRAALAPANPSSQDYSIAASASEMANNARLELLRLQQTTDARGSKLDIHV